MSTELTGSTPTGFGSGPQPAETPGFETRHNIERIAWIVLFVAFAVFMVLLIAAPLTINYTLQTATAAQTATIDPTGTILLTPPGATEAIALTDLRKDVVEGSVVDAVENGTQATIRLISEGSGDEALGSIQLYSGARLALATMRSPMFEASDQPYQARLKLERGQARIFTDSGQKRPVRVLLETPHGEIALDTGSYQVAVTPEQTDITVSAGAATLMKPDKPVLVVDEGLRAWITADSMAGAAVSATQNLLRNGNFTEPMRDTWESYVLAQNVTPGKVNIMDRDGRRVAYFVRQGEDNVPTEVGIRQQVNKDINVYDKLFLQLDVKLLFQSLPGAGYLSSEYPLRVEVAYTDVYGKQLTWGHGFYFRDPENPNWQIVGGQKIQPFNWFTYRSPNLMELLKDTRPARIDSIRVYASGWNYQSMVSEVYLEAE